jgi:DNA-binding MarR family transcriptional regulator
MSGIQRELKQTRPFASKALEAAVALMRTADLVRRNVAAILEAYDVTPQQYNVLRILRGAGEKGLPTLDIAERMIEETPGITRLIDRLEAKSHVSRERCLTDRRKVFCRITRDGLQLLARIDDPLALAEERSMSGLKSRQLADLVALLDQVREGLDRSLINQRAQNDVRRGAHNQR